MSGYAGIVSLDNAPPDRALLDRMAAALAFRGPDATHVTTQPGAGFAFTLLRTGPAPQSSQHPCTLDGRVWLIGDVRLDGRDDLRRKLEQHGASIPSTVTDEELILHAVSQFGVDSLPELDGDFSFVLWNSTEGTFCGFRDLTGARPFFYSFRGGKLCFSNTIQALLADADVSHKEYDQQFIADFLLGSPYHDQDRTIYRDVRRLPAGHLLQFSPLGFSVRRITDFPVEELLRFKRDQEVVEEFRRLLMQSVADRLPTINTSIFLSGGLDSTSIAASVVALRRQASGNAPLNFFGLCVDFQPLFHDSEGQLASRFADAFGFPLQAAHSGSVLPFAGWDESAPLFPEPPADPFSLLYLSYRRQLSPASRVVLSGDGGDEVLRLLAAPYLRFLASHKGLFVAFSTLVRWTLSHRQLPPLGFGIRSGLFRALGHKPAHLTYPPWLTPDFERRHGLSDRWLELSAPPPSRHPFNPKAYYALNSGLFGEVQELCDPVWTSVPLETRNPFLDRRLCRFLLRIPVIPWAMHKHLLRISQVGILPEEIRSRPKTPVLQDPLILHVASRNWNPVPTGRPSPVLDPIVDWPKLLASLANTFDLSLYTHLRPVALSRWLNAVETDHRIQYSQAGISSYENRARATS
jgi:asparagine synthase (glutamine-hydrolysing)